MGSEESQTIHSKANIIELTKYNKTLKFVYIFISCCTYQFIFTFIPVKHNYLNELGVKQEKFIFKFNFRDVSVLSTGMIGLSQNTTIQDIRESVQPVHVVSATGTVSNYNYVLWEHKFILTILKSIDVNPTLKLKTK